ncbi:MAG: hypothetical protein MPW14_25485 (plasmid) [Candidatus Manganitrophus sp.]|nr:MAG: hypothetical protein MPW14_25485 [Candidatus Manganitrophus sp.]
MPTRRSMSWGLRGEARHAQAARGVVTNRYNGGTIVAYADGHVEYLKREAVYLDPRSGKPSNRLWNGFGRDNDEDGDGAFEPASETVTDNNEWVTLTGVNTVIDTKMTGTASGNSSFLQGAPTMLALADPIVWGGATSTAGDLLTDANGPTTPKRRPFPITLTVLGQTLVNK